MTEPSALGDRLPGDLPFDDLLAHLREGYTNGISDILDACIAPLILPQHQEAVLLDAAQFLTFIIAIKIVEANRQPVERLNLLQAYRKIDKTLDREVPGMLIEMAKVAQRQAEQPKGDPA